MKKLFLLGLISCFTLVSRAQFTKADLHATGLTCAMCSNAINQALKKLPFIETVKSDIKNSSFAITFKSAGEVNVDAIKDAVEDAGFSVGKLELSGQLNGVAVGKDKHVTIGKSVYHFVNTGDRVLDGSTKVVVVDKDFTSAKNHKKLTAGSTMSCVQTGKAGSCCTQEGISADARVYHVTI